MHSKPLDSSAPIAAPSDFFKHLAEGLHAMAQPLTILRSVAVASAATELQPTERLRYLDISREQIERTCGLFECLQDLVIAQRYRSNRDIFDLAHLVTEVVTDCEFDLRASGAELSNGATGHPVFLCGDLQRTRLAAGAAIKVALSLYGSGDVIELLLEQSNGSAELSVACKRCHNTPLNSLQNLRLALAETNMRSQGGQYECVVDPFCVRFVLPAPDAELENEAARQGAPPTHPYSASILPPDGNRRESERQL